MRAIRAGKGVARLLLAAVVGAGLASCAQPQANVSQGRPGEAMAPLLIRQLVETGNIISAGLDLHAVGAEVPATLALSAEAARRDLRSGSGMSSLTWIGHATFVIRSGGTTVLTDPNFSMRAFSDVLGPRRLAPLPLDVDDLPAIDVIVISHADVDHLDTRSLRRLARRNPQAAVVTPRRNRDLVAGMGFREVRELGWGDAAQFGDVTIQALPAYHSSRREPGNPFRRRWASYGIEGSGVKLFFAGDTGYGPAFGQIGRAHGPYNIALVPIGAYEPRSAVRHMHVNPEEAAMIARELGAELAVGMHWGTFGLSPEPFLEPRERFLEAGGGGLTTRTLRIGETLPLH